MAESPFDTLMQVSMGFAALGLPRQCQWPGAGHGVAEPLSYPLYSTISKITVLESGSKSGDRSNNFFTNSSCLSAPPTLLRNGSVLLYGSFSKYICVTILSWRPLTWKWMCAGLILLGPAG